MLPIKYISLLFIYVIYASFDKVQYLTILQTKFKYSQFTMIVQHNYHKRMLYTY